jgi:hypothetical protein
MSLSLIADKVEIHLHGQAGDFLLHGFSTGFSTTLLKTEPCHLHAKQFSSLSRELHSIVLWVSIRQAGTLCIKGIRQEGGVGLLGPTPQHCAFINGSAYRTFLRVCITARPIDLRAAWLTNGPATNFKRLHSRPETTSRGRLSGHLKRFLERLTNHASEVPGYLSRPQKPHRRPQSRPHRRPSDSLWVDLLSNRGSHLRYSVILRMMSSRPAL